MVDRTRAISIAAFIGVVIFAGIGVGIDALGWNPPFWLTTPSAAAFFGIFFRAYDRVFWRVRIGRVRMSHVPDLNGEWIGSIDIEGGPVRDEELMGVRCAVKVQQTWSQLRVTFDTQFTHSVSSMASLGDSEFRYEYMVETKDGSGYPTDMKKHGGMARMWFRDGNAGGVEAMSGSFYNDKDYQRFGRYDLRRAKSRSEFDAWIPRNGRDIDLPQKEDELRV